MSAKGIGLVVMLFVGLSQSALAAEFATLFTTPEERALIDRNRYKSLETETEQQPVENADDNDGMQLEPASYESVTREYKISGITLSQTGPHTVWINSVAYEDGARLDDDSRVEVIDGAEVGVRITAPDGKHYYATSGETLEVTHLVPIRN
jgi:hypothetical protein